MSTVNNGPQIVKSGLVLDLDASLVSSYSAIAVYSVQCYSTFSGGLRSANYTVQYSDDNSTWTTAFTGVMSNNSSCGIITGTNRNDSNYGKHRYWRYVEGGAVVGHHPRVSRIDFITKSGAIYNLTTYTTDNCADSGTYIVGTVTKDFGTTTWRDTSGNSNNGTLTSGPTFSSSNKGIIVFDYIDDAVTIAGTLGTPSTFTLSAWVRSSNISQAQNIFNANPPFFLRITSSTIRCAVYTGSWIFVNGNITLSSNVWYNLVLTYDQSYVKGYVNGVLDVNSAKTGTPIWGGAGSIRLGYTTGGEDAPSVTNIAAAQIYNRSLTASEISQNYETTKTRFGL